MQKMLVNDEERSTEKLTVSNSTLRVNVLVLPFDTPRTNVPQAADV